MIDEPIGRMQALGETLRAADDPRQYFHATYLRTTIAVRDEIRRGGFLDADWVERWDVIRPRSRACPHGVSQQPASPWIRSRVEVAATMTPFAAPGTA